MKKTTLFLSCFFLLQLLNFHSIHATGWKSLNGPAGYFSPQFVYFHQGAWYVSSNTNSSYGTGVWKSTSNGFNWTDVSAGLPKPYARDFTALGGELYVASDTGVYKTSNGGVTWTSIENGLPDFTSVYELETHNNSVYACVYYGTGNVELFYLTAGNNTWVSTGYTFTFSMIPNEVFSNGNNLWVATSAGLYKSTDNGITFSYAGNNIPFNASVTSIVANGDTAYCGTTNGSYFTTDGGQLWMPISIPALGTTISTYSWKIVGNTIFAAFTNFGVYSCTLGQTNFTVFGTNYISNNLAWQMASDGNYLFAATSEGIYSCPVSGGSWQNQNSNITRARTRIAYADFQVIFAGSGAFTGLYRSTDGGQTWSLTSLQNQFRLFGHGLSYNQRIFLPSNTGIHYTDDLGLTFNSPQVAPIPNYDIKVYGDRLIAGGGANVLQSTDNGVTWSNLGTGIPSSLTVYSLQVYGSKILAGTNNGIYRYDPVTGIWSNFSQGITGNVLVSNIAASGLSLVINTHQGIYRRSPSDNAWQLVNFSSFFNDMIDFGGLIFGAGIDGVSVSDDGGKTFRSYNDSLPEYAGEGESLYGDFQTLFVGMREYSAWSREVERPIYIPGYYSPYLCAGDSITINANNFATVNSGNKYILQLSDSNGDFFNATAVDSITSTSTAFTLKLRIPLSTPAGSHYRIRVVSTSPILFTQQYEGMFTIRTQPAIQLQPANQSTCDGNSTGFYVGATGSDLYYQWQVDVNGSGNFTNINNSSLYQGVDSNLLLISSAAISMNGYKYRCVITNPCTIITTNSATLNISNLTPIIVQPVNDTTCFGGPVQFNVAAAGTGNTYQWQVNVGLGWTNISGGGGQYTGATTSTLFLNYTLIVDNIRNYRCLINGCTSSDTVRAVMIGVPVSYTLPDSIPYCDNADLNINVQYTGIGLSYQWEEDAGSGFTPLSNGGQYQGVNTASLSLLAVPASYDGRQYRCKVVGGCAPDSSYSTTVSLELQTSPSVTLQPLTTAVCEGDTATFTALGTGTFLNYQWELNDGTGWAAIPFGLSYFNGQITPTLTVSNTEMLLNGLQFRCNLSGCVKTQTATLNVKAMPVVAAPQIIWCTLFNNIQFYQATPPGGTYFGNQIENNYFTGDYYNYNQFPYDYVYTAPNGCTASAGNIIIIANCGGTAEVGKNEAELILYPNPAMSQVTLKLPVNSNSSGTVSVYNIDGRLEKSLSGMLPNEEFTLDVQDLSDGIYLVQVRTSDRTFTQKLLILH